MQREPGGWSWPRGEVLLDNVHDAVISTDMDGIIRSWNPAASRIYGWSAGEVIGCHVGLLYFAEDRHLLQSEVLEPSRVKGSHEVTLRNRHRSGAEIHVALRLSLLRNESGTPVGFIGCSSDITHQRRAEAALREAKKLSDESLSLLGTLFRTAPVGLAFVDCDLRFVRINEALAEINGVPVADHMGRRVRDVVPALAPTLEPVYRSVIETRCPVVNLEINGETAARPGELRHWLANYYPVEARGRELLGVGVVVIEITGRKRAQEAIRRERDLSEGLIQTAQSIVLMLDPLGRIVRFNPFMEKLSGYCLEEVRGKDWFRTFLPQRDRERIRGVFHKAVDRLETRGIVNAIVTKDGSERQISWWDTTLTDPEGDVLGVLAIGHDITELLEAQERALRAERLAAIGETITTIAHESRNELVNVGIGLMLLARDGPVEPEEARILKLLQESHSRLERLFEDLRAFAAPIKLEWAECDLVETWRRAWTSLGARWEDRRAVLEERIGGDSFICVADALRIEQVFRNLFENSLAACPEAVRIEVSCRNVEIGGTRQVRLAVRDDGPGLLPAYTEKLFDPFFTTKHDGIGLGLAIVRRILDAHGGTIAVGETRPGAEFVITLPAEDEGVDAPDQADDPPDP